MDPYKEFVKLMLPVEERESFELVKVEVNTYSSDTKTCTRESRSAPFANLKVPPCRSRLQTYKIHFTFHLFSVSFD